MLRGNSIQAPRSASTGAGSASSPADDGGKAAEPGVTAELDSLQLLGGGLIWLRSQNLWAVVTSKTRSIGYAWATSERREEHARSSRREADGDRPKGMVYVLRLVPAYFVPGLGVQAANRSLDQDSKRSWSYADGSDQSAAQWARSLFMTSTSSLRVPSYGSGSQRLRS